MRKKIRNLHLYIAMATGVILILVAASGSLLVFELQMDRWFDRAANDVAPRGKPAGFSRMVAQVRSAYPNREISEINVGEPNQSVMLRLGAPGQAGGLRVFIDPYDGWIIAARSGEPASFHLRHLHRELLAGKAGALVVSAATFLLLAQSVSGLYLWWPLKRLSVKMSGPPHRILFDSHCAIGFFSSALVFLMAATGLIKGYGDALQPFFDDITNSPVMTRNILSRSPAAGAATIDIDRAVAIAAGELPGAAVARIVPPKGRSGPFVVTMKFPGDSTAPGRSWVVVDRWSGEVLSKLDSRKGPVGSRIPIVNRAIHVGGIYGAPTRILAFLTAWAVLAQIGTGYILWWRKRARKAEASRTRNAAASAGPAFIVR